MRVKRFPDRRLYGRNCMRGTRVYVEGKTPMHDPRIIYNKSNVAHP